MKRILFIFFFIVAAISLSAQCTLKNTAFKAGEHISYNLYFNWKFVWYKVGTANMSVSNSKYKGRDALKCVLLSKSNGKLDRHFYMRDTLLSYVTPQLVPLYYRKGAHEGKRYTVDEVWYDYPDDKCHAKMRRLNNDKTVTNNDDTRSECIFDMISLFLRARNFISNKWQPGHVIKVPYASGRGVKTGLITYKGTEKVKADNGIHYNCLKLDFAQWNSKKKKYDRIATFFITNDSRHIPVRLDFNLRFGSAKAFLTSMKGI